jgi:hypothetical protein
MVVAAMPPVREAMSCSGGSEDARVGRPAGHAGSGASPAVFCADIADDFVKLGIE